MIGLTGGIGSGKSTVARILHHLGYPVYISDRKASRLMNTHPTIRTSLIKRFGNEVYTPEGKINKPFLAPLIFNHPEVLKEINQIVHPRVMEDFQQWSLQQHHSCVFFESAILFEAGLADYFQSVICVTAPENIRLDRVIARDGIAPEQVKERMRNQLNDQLKCEQADFIIHNDFKHQVMEQLFLILEKIKTN